MQLATDKLKKRIDSAWAVKSQWDDLYRDAYEYALPHRNLYNTTAEGERKTDRVFDSTAVMATIRFANRLQSDLTPAFQQWAKLGAGPGIPEDKKVEVNTILEAMTDTLFAAIHVSNFDTAINEHYLDLATGTASMMVLENDDQDRPFRFVPVPNAQIALDEGPFGEVWGIFRRHKVKAGNIKAQWAGFTIKLDGLEGTIKDEPDKKMTFDEACYFDYEEQVWRYEVMYFAESDKKGQRIVEATYHESPWLVTRWIKVAGEAMGRGPLLTALPDIKTLNAVIELILKNASLSIAGVWTGVDDGVLNPNNISIIPGAVIPVARNGGPSGPSLQALERPGDFSVAELVINEMRDSVKQMMMDDKLPPDSAQPRSATEIIERVKDLQQDIGSPFGRLMSELIRPLVQRCLSIMQRKGLIDIPVKINGVNVKVQVTSPLAQVQNLDEVEAVVRWMQINQGTVGQELSLLGAKVEDIPEFIGERLGVDASLIRDEKDRDKIQQLVAQFIAQTQMQQPEAA